MFNPLTALSLGASGWILVMGLNRPIVSATVLAIALILGTLKTRNFALIAAVAALAVPVALSMVLIHAPYGQERIAPLITKDGLDVAGVLALRFSALMACILSAGVFIRVPDLAKVLQVRRGGNRLSYIAGATLQLIPQASARVRAVRDANRLQARPITAKTVVPHVIMPVLSELLTLSAHRGRALETAGYGIAGPRTVLRPVHDSTLQRIIRIAAPLVCLGVAIWI
ncbi:ABC transporter permease [Corynebacterium riegelii]